MRLRRSYSTPSETRPATSRRVTLNRSRRTPAADHRERERPQVWPPSRMSFTVRPTR